jgi:menaquinone-dependent protoporphyrinogen IX oxidase
MGRWLPAAVRFVEQHVAALRLVPTAFFTVHMLNIDDSVGSIQRRRAYLDPVRATFTPDHEAYFAGRMALDHLGTMDRLIARLVKARDGDLRHWRAIRDWADEITIPPPAT